MRNSKSHWAWLSFLDLGDLSGARLSDLYEAFSRVTCYRFTHSKHDILIAKCEARYRSTG